jgi:hypothetical protein
LFTAIPGYGKRPVVPGPILLSKLLLIHTFLALDRVFGVEVELDGSSMDAWLVVVYGWVSSKGGWVGILLVGLSWEEHGIKFWRRVKDEQGGNAHNQPTHSTSSTGVVVCMSPYAVRSHVNGELDTIERCRRAGK